MVGALYQRSQEDLELSRIMMLGYTLGVDWLGTAISLLLLVLWSMCVVWTGCGVGRNLLLLPMSRWFLLL